MTFITRNNIYQGAHDIESYHDREVLMRAIFKLNQLLKDPVMVSYMGDFTQPQYKYAGTGTIIHYQEPHNILRNYL